MQDAPKVKEPSASDQPVSEVICSVMPQIGNICIFCYIAIKHHLFLQFSLKRVSVFLPFKKGNLFGLGIRAESVQSKPQAYCSDASLCCNSTPSRKIPVDQNTSQQKVSNKAKWREEQCDGAQNEEQKKE